MELSSQHHIMLRHWVLSLLLAVAALFIATRLRNFIHKLEIYLKYCRSHKAFSVEAGEGKYRWLEDPFSQSPNYWLCRHVAIKHVFSRAAM